VYGDEIHFFMFSNDKPQIVHGHGGVAATSVVESSLASPHLAEELGQDLASQHGHHLCRGLNQRRRRLQASSGPAQRRSSSTRGWQRRQLQGELMAWRRLGERWRGWEDEAATEERSSPTDSSGPIPPGRVLFLGHA
jgi:hypothetical protein